MQPVARFALFRRRRPLPVLKAPLKVKPLDPERAATYRRFLAVHIHFAAQRSALH